MTARRLAPFLAALVLAPFAPARAELDIGPVAAVDVKPHPCRIAGIKETVRCATRAVWEDRAARKGRRIGLNVGNQYCREPINCAAFVASKSSSLLN